MPKMDNISTRALKVISTSTELPTLLDIFNSARAGAGCFSRLNANLSEFTAQLEGEEIYLAECDRQIVGFVGVWSAENFIHHLYVAPQFQFRGIGRMLLDLCQQTYGLPLSLKCEMGNAHAIGFYLRGGWVEGESGLGRDGPWVKLWLNK
jgi:ribosomal protein S18 acetylase RimI-like enzyme